MRKVCVVIGSRANYGSSRSWCRAASIATQISSEGRRCSIARYVVDVIERDGHPRSQGDMIVEGERR